MNLERPYDLLIDKLRFHQLFTQYQNDINIYYKATKNDLGSRYLPNLKKLKQMTIL